MAARPPRGVMLKNKVENPGKIIKRLLGYLMKYYGLQMVIVVFCIIISVYSSLQGTMFTKILIDNYLTPFVKKGIEVDFHKLFYQDMLPVLLLYACGIIASFAQQLIMVKVTQGTLMRIRNELFTHMESLPIKYFDQNSHGDIMSIYTNDIDTLRQMISQSIPQLLQSFLSVIGTLIYMIIIDVPLTILTLVMVGVMMFITAKLGKLSGGYFLQQQKSLGKVNGFIEEQITGQKVVKVFNHEEECIEEFDKINEELCDSANNANKFANILMPVNAQLGHLSYVLCTVIGAFIAVMGFTRLSLGGLASFLQYNQNFNRPISQISMQFNAVIMSLAGADRIFRLLDEKPEEDGGYVTLVNAKENPDGSLTETTEHTGIWAWRHEHQESHEVEYKRLQGAIYMDDVDFGYVPEKLVLHNVTIDAKPGQKIAFVGSTGAGKTTITNLINRFYDIQDGKIRFDGINVNKIKKGDLRRSLGLVLQETHLFTDTVMENIRYGRLDATDEECIAAAKLANADLFIRQLPDGYNTVLTGDGGNLSQGQRQLLAIARAAVADPPALILDEATSSIDTRTEREVQEGMDSLMAGRTTFVIAHRLSTVKNSDCIIVLEKGSIIERGSHAELIAKKGKYYQLYTGLSA